LELYRIRYGIYYKEERKEKKKRKKDKKQNIYFSSKKIRMEKPENTFPWIRNQIEDPNKLFNHLREYQPTILNEKSTYKYIVWKYKKYNQNKFRNINYFSFLTQKPDYENIDRLVDYFNENPRMHAKRRDKKYTPMEIWENPKRLDNDKNHHILENVSIRDRIWKLGYECNAFKATLAKSIYMFFNAKRILDFSAGWGDRLLAAIAHEADRYLGYDPNIELQKGYQEIITLFSEKEQAKEQEKENKKYEIIAEPFETATLPENETFDLICTSPPYFDFEVYIPNKEKQSENQSIIKYPKFNDWMIHFLLVSFWKSWNVLDVNGNMVIHLSDVYKTHYVEIMIFFILGWCKGARFDGSIASIGDCGKPRPIWIFHKTDNNVIDIDARKQLEIHYNELFRLIRNTSTTV